MSTPTRIQRRQLEGTDRAGEQSTQYWVSLDEAGRVNRAAATLEELMLQGPQSSPLLRRLQDAPLLAAGDPSKIVCVGLNYGRHAEEMNKPLPDSPLIFLKPSTAVIGPGAAIELPGDSVEVHHEGELAVVIGAVAKDVKAADADAVILGYTIMNDVTARDIQRREGRYTRAKGYDTFAPLGPTIVSGICPDQVTVQVRVNGELRQSSGCDDMIFAVPSLVAFISSIMTLNPGDVISTGTPSGVGPIRDGDVVEVSIDGLGVLSNPVRARRL